MRRTNEGTRIHLLANLVSDRRYCFHDLEPEFYATLRVEVNMQCWHTIDKVISMLSCRLIEAKRDKYIYPLVMNTGSDSTGKWACQ